MGEGQSLSAAFSRGVHARNGRGSHSDVYKHNIDDGFIWQFCRSRSITLSLIAAIETSPCAACIGSHVAEGSVATSDASSPSNRRRPRPTTRRSARRHGNSRRQRGSGKPSSGRKRLRWQESANGASAPSERPRQRSIRRSASMKPRQGKSKPSATQSRSGPRPRRPAGRSSGRSCRPPSAGRGSRAGAPLKSSRNGPSPRRLDSPTPCWRSVMKRVLTLACAAAIALGSCGAAEAKGCIKGAVVGGVAGLTESSAPRRDAS
jgi:hypothetical protein